MKSASLDTRSSYVVGLLVREGQEVRDDRGVHALLRSVRERLLAVGTVCGVRPAAPAMNRALLGTALTDLHPIARHSLDDCGQPLAKVRFRAGRIHRGVEEGLLKADRLRGAGLGYQTLGLADDRAGQRPPVASPYVHPAIPVELEVPEVDEDPSPHVPAFGSLVAEQEYGRPLRGARGRNTPGDEAPGGN